MAKTKSKIDGKIIDSLRGILDFYPRGNETIIRTWPRDKGRSQTPRSVAWQAVFRCFHRIYTGWWIGGGPFIHRSLLGKAWNARDYNMWLYYGKAPKPPTLLLDNRPPFPPPCPDPLNRYAVFNLPIGTYSIFGTVRLYFSRHPAGSAMLWMTHTKPLYARRYATRRGVRHEIGAAIVPRPCLWYHGFAPPHEDYRGTNRVSFYEAPSQRFYFFLVPYTGWYRHTISISQWFVCDVIPGPGGGTMGARLAGPYPLSTYNIDYPERPLG